MTMFWNPRKEEEVFLNKLKAEQRAEELPDFSLQKIKEKIEEDFKEQPVVEQTPPEIVSAKQNFEMADIPVYPD